MGFSGLEWQVKEMPHSIGLLHFPPGSPCFFLTGDNRCDLDHMLRHLPSHQGLGSKKTQPGREPIDGGG